MFDSQTHVLPSGTTVPFFQPILSLETLSIAGYEVLGREIVQDEIRSLGPFFQSSSVPDHMKIMLDRKLRGSAFHWAAASGYDGLLFINLKPGWILNTFRDTGTLQTLEMLKQYGFPANQVVIEITEEAFSGKLSELKEIIENYRRRSCRIAVDDLGSGFSSLDRIAVIQPDIIKIDLKILKKSAFHDGYKALMRSFSTIAEQIGASLLVEGVETETDLYNALSAGARYVQGFLFSEARSDFQPADRYAAMLRSELKRYGKESYASFQRMMDVERVLLQLAERTATTDFDAEQDADALVESLLHVVPDNGLRVHIIRVDGQQLSSNFERGIGGEWHRNETYRGSNWLWRPYFIPNVVHMQKQRSGMLSQAYIDPDFSLPIQTYSCPVGEEQYLFVDLIIR